jgi:hypothetical protein
VCVISARKCHDAAVPGGAVAGEISSSRVFAVIDRSIQAKSGGGAFMG